MLLRESLYEHFNVVQTMKMFAKILLLQLFPCGDSTSNHCPTTSGGAWVVYGTG